MTTSNFKEDILEAVDEEIKEAIIIVFSDFDMDDKNKKFPKELYHKPLKLNSVIDYFDYIYDDGFGCQECHSIYIFTKTKLCFIHEYDGATYIETIPRNPEDYNND